MHLRPGSHQWLIARYRLAVAQILIRNLDDDVKARLQARAEEHGQSMEAEAREILRNALHSSPEPKGLGTRMAARFAEIGLDEPFPELHGEMRPAVFE